MQASVDSQPYESHRELRRSPSPIKNVMGKKRTLSVSEYLNLKSDFGVEGYKVPLFNSHMDDKFSRMHTQSRLCKDKKQHSMIQLVKHKSLIPGPSHYEVKNTSASLLMKNIIKPKLYSHERSTFIDDFYSKAKKENITASPFTYKPEKLNVIPGSRVKGTYK